MLIDKINNRNKVMKANEAPEKLYLDTTDNPDNVWLRAFRPPFNKPPFNTGIEYTRTDAFIEKACEFLKSYRQDTCDGLGYIAGIVNDETIEDFKKYMKGE